MKISSNRALEGNRQTRAQQPRSARQFNSVIWRPKPTSAQQNSGITTPNNFTKEQKTIAKQAVQDRFEGGKAIGMREPTKGEIAFLKTIAKKFGAGKKELSKIDEAKVMIVFATGPKGKLVNKNGRTIAGAVGGPNKDGYIFMVLNSKYTDINYSRSKDNGARGQSPQASGIFTHEATHILQRVGAIPFTGRGDEVKGQKDDYNYKPEIELGISKEELTREDQAVYVARNYASLLVDKGQKPRTDRSKPS